MLAATEVVFGAVDVLDSRYESFKFTLTDVVADNASAGALLPRARSPAGPTSWRTCALLGCVVRVDGEVVMTAAGAAVMGHPAASVAWLANQLAAKGERPQGRAADLLRRRHRPGAGGRRRQRHLRVRRARRHRGLRRLSRSGLAHQAGERWADVLASTAVVTTDAAVRYAKQLLSHLGRKAGVEPRRRRPEPAGRLVFAYGVGTVLPRTGDLVLRGRSAADEESLAQCQDVLARHLERSAPGAS